MQAAGLEETLVHTGQHYDIRMSDIFFDELGLPDPDINLGVGSGPHGWQTGVMLASVEATMLAEQPDWVLVYGDTNSTLAGALAAVKLGIPLAHVEAGLRSFNREMPEELNRVLTDHSADLLFCPTETAVKNLSDEGLLDRVHHVGDTMFDAIRQFSALSRDKSSILSDLGLQPGRFVLATTHRPYNTDDPERLAAILRALDGLGETVVFAVHPRTQNQIDQLQGGAPMFSPSSPVRPIDPVGYLDMLALEENARLILTDSGGMQKEAFLFEVPCITIRPETEWVETVEAGWNVLVEPTEEAIHSAVKNFSPPDSPQPGIFGDGHAAEKIVSHLVSAC